MRFILQILCSLLLSQSVFAQSDSSLPPDDSSADSFDDDFQGPPPPIVDESPEELDGIDLSEEFDDEQVEEETGESRREARPRPKKRPPSDAVASYPEELFQKQMLWGTGMYCAGLFLPAGAVLAPFVTAYLVSKEGVEAGYAEDWLIPGLVGFAVGMAISTMVGAVIFGLYIAVGVAALLAGIVIGGTFFSTIASVTLYGGSLVALATAPFAILGANAAIVPFSIVSMYENRAEKVRSKHSSRRRVQKQNQPGTLVLNAMAY